MPEKKVAVRTMKLRAWDIENKVMLSPEELYKRSIYWITDGRGFVSWKTGEIFTDDLTNEWMNHYIPLWFTGLLDKNGSELYRSDLIINSSRNGDKPHEIVWSNKYGAWCGKYGSLEYLIGEELDEITKVGNIYENPELVK